ncbi:MAG: YifB family Mg chelatase-like AAA ATPase [Agrococcus casei]|uniref:YifB family Mg chelatase-like AAA ATPase n=1 Tax=Agrococcus casei TaxID=343512 RepID=UPI003F96274C
MTIGRATSIALHGLEGTLVPVEADVLQGLPKVHMVGMPDASVRQSQHRTWSAMRHSGFTPPETKVVINLTPASLPKAGSHFDLAIAIALLRASRVVPEEESESTVCIGELGLDGRLRPSRGVLPMVLAAQRCGIARVVVPSANVPEAELVDDVSVIGAASLAHAASALGADIAPYPVEAIRFDEVEEAQSQRLDMVDVLGNEAAIAALELAAAGRHHMIMVGPPGAGKTMLAARLPTILPELTTEQALEAASVRSLTSERPSDRLDLSPPFESPHHSSTAASLIGGGSAGQIRPGAAVRAGHGVLFLDEAPEFPRSVLDMLRQPIESGEVVIHRARGVARFPASFQLVMAANPCPCGKLGNGDCTCSSRERMSYFSRLSGPLMDRIDLQVRVSRLSSVSRSAAQPSATSNEIRARVLEARARASHRLCDTPWRAMGEVSGTWLRKTHPLAQGETKAIDTALERGLITMRGYDRILRMAWTTGDLDSAPAPTSAHLARSLAFRKALQ